MRQRTGPQAAQEDRPAWTKTSKKELTTQQRTLLTNARDAIRRTPENYDQLTYGVGSISCRTPGCVAGHIIANDAELRDKLAETLAEKNVTNEAGREYAAKAIHEIATAALGTRSYPLLFQSEWPVAWLENNTSNKPDRRRHDDSFVPRPSDAIEVLDGILDGRIQGALGY